MVKVKEIEVFKEDYNDLEQYLIKHDLLDNSKLWFAGFDDKTRGQRNAMAANLLSGNKKLDIVTVKGNMLYRLVHIKNGFSVYEYADLNTQLKVKVYRNFLYPSIEIFNESDEWLQIQAKYNKNKVHNLKKMIKEHQ